MFMQAGLIYTGVIEECDISRLSTFSENYGNMSTRAAFKGFLIKNVQYA